MAKNNNNSDDLYSENDLVTDFLNDDDSKTSTNDDILDLNQSPAPDDIHQINQLDSLDSHSSNLPPLPEDQSMSAQSPVDSSTNQSEPQDWIENTKVDLPGQLALDIYETKDKLIIISRVAGVREKDLDVSISADNVLNVRGTLSTKVENVENYFIQECYWGEFSRSISLPVDVKKDDINATLENGILQVVFTKIKQDAVKKINIQSK